MSPYEFVFITKDDNKNLLKKIEKLISDFGGVVDKQDNWGKRPFAYKLKNLVEGYYYVWSLTFDSKKIKEFKQKLNLEEEVVRYLLLKK